MVLTVGTFTLLYTVLTVCVQEKAVLINRVRVAVQLQGDTNDQLD
jgi:hypothetical protein